MSVLITGLDGWDFGDTLELAVTTGLGLFAGRALLSDAPPWGLAAWGDDETTPQVDGFRAGDTLRFLAWSAKTGLEYRAVASVGEGTITYEPNGLLVTKLTLFPNPELPDDGSAAPYKDAK